MRAFFKFAIFLAAALFLGACQKTPQHLSVDFSNAQLQGVELAHFSDAEPWGRWTDGSPATLTFKVKLPPRFSLRLVLDGSMYDNVGKPVEVHVGQSTYFFDAPGANADISLNVINAPEGNNQISFTIPHPVSPKSLKASDDSRLLGIKFVKLFIDEVQ